ncbi:MAG: helix-turn-helix domain-containing protein [Candidatus Freyarchaeota archaeon]|nr:helix-turn-helix domain-containing protein [Candidatus Jordarchaeia archaeon]MBS7267936.1 helix-turn-helix domain-containing protein [Candidatus Jordarchaeia archaeon]MBS7279853.1 helix-turn-helix domain-containing protein [Candidatus Jordarchaeia archaeon]
MKRTNTFTLAPTKKQHQQLLEVADACARLWNELNYRRRQTFFRGKSTGGAKTSTISIRV